MKGIKRIVMSIMVLCLVLAGLLTPQRVYANSWRSVGTKANIEEDSGSSLNEKRELIAKYTGYKEHNLNYYSEITVDGKKCSAFEYVDDGGGASDVMLIIFEDGKIVGLSATGEYIDVKAKKKNKDKTVKASYKMKKDKIEYKDNSGKVRGIVSFQYPQFKGTSDSIKKVNSLIKKESSKFIKSETAKTLKDYTLSAIKNDQFYDETEQYYWITTCKISYNKNNIISIHMHEKWYAGGVGNEQEYGLNYNLKTGKKLTVNHVISGKAKEKILEAAKIYCGSDTNAYNIIKNTKNYEFYLKEGKVYICFGTYVLERGNAHDVFSVTGKYK